MFVPANPPTSVPPPGVPAASVPEGVRSGGSAKDELERAGAYRVYEDPADLLRHLDELGVAAE